MDFTDDLTFLTLASFSFSKANLILSAFVWGSFLKEIKTNKLFFSSQEIATLSP